MAPAAKAKRKGRVSTKLTHAHVEAAAAKVVDDGAKSDFELTSAKVETALLRAGVVVKKSPSKIVKGVTPAQSGKWKLDSHEAKQPLDRVGTQAGTPGRR